MNIPTKVRGWIYIVNIFLAPLVVYLQDDNLINTAQAALLGAWLGGASLLARMNLAEEV